MEKRPVSNSFKKADLVPFTLYSKHQRPWMDDPPIGSAPLWNLAPLSLSEPPWQFSDLDLQGSHEPNIVVEGLGIDNGKTPLQTIIAMIRSEG